MKACSDILSCVDYLENVLLRDEEWTQTNCFINDIFYLTPSTWYIYDHKVSRSAYIHVGMQSEHTCSSASISTSCAWSRTSGNSLVSPTLTLVGTPLLSKWLQTVLKVVPFKYNSVFRMFIGKLHVFMIFNAAGFLWTRNLYLPLDPDETIK